MLVFEALAHNIRVNPSMNGLRLPNSSVPLPGVSSYTDNTSLVVCSDLSIHEVSTVLCFVFFLHFERGSGAKLNR